MYVNKGPGNDCKTVSNRWRTYRGKECRAPSSGSGCIPSCGCSFLPWMSDSLAFRMWPCPSDWSTTARKKKMYTHFIFFSFRTGNMANISLNSWPASNLIQSTCLCVKAYYYTVNKHRQHVSAFSPFLSAVDRNSAWSLVMHMNQSTFAVRPPAWFRHTVGQKSI